MKPNVKVIAYTKFLGVPEELLPTGHELVSMDEKCQDQGNHLARLTECAARTCYDSYGKGRSSEDFHHHIKQVGHGSVLEHASISFYISGISRGCSHELVRHRAGCAISQRSTRYVDESESDWCWHPLMVEFLKKESDTYLEDFSNKIKNQTGYLYRRLVSGIEEGLIKSGIDKQTARKQARGAARGVLGNALETSMVWTANIRALRNVIEQRASRFADAEIRLLANRLWEEAVVVCPEYFCDYQPKECPDGIGYELITEYRKI